MLESNDKKQQLQSLSTPNATALSATLPARATVTAAPTPRPPLPPALPPVYYQQGASIDAVYPDGSGQTTVATIPTGTRRLPQLLPDGRLFYPTGSGYTAVDRYGRMSGIRTPDLGPDESVWSLAPAPDGRTLAWQIFAPLHLNGSIYLHQGKARIVLTGRFGDAGATIFTARAGGSDGQVPVLLGWRRSSPYGVGGPTLLLQDLYNAEDAPAGVTFNTARGLLEYDPTIADVVDDYLPPLGPDIPAQRAFDVSADGRWAVYGDANAFTPSGDGPLARVVDALNLNTNRVVLLDAAGRYPTKKTIVTVRKHQDGKRTRTTRAMTMVRLYQYFSHNAFVAPGDGRVLYTELTVSYPSGARLPRVDRQALVATMNGQTTRVLAGNAQGVGWLNSTTAVLARRDGLYTVDVTSGTLNRIAAGATARFIGMRAR